MDKNITLYPGLAEKRKDLFNGATRREKVMSYPFNKMEVGDGFTIGPMSEEELEVRSRRVRSAASRYAKTNDMTFQCVRSSDEGMIYVIRRA